METNMKYSPLMFVGYRLPSMVRELSQLCSSCYCIKSTTIELYVQCQTAMSVGRCHKWQTVPFLRGTLGSMILSGKELQEQTPSFV
jgi:hypothetical protein